MPDNIEKLLEQQPVFDVDNLASDMAFEYARHRALSMGAPPDLAERTASAYVVQRYEPMVSAQPGLALDRIRQYTTEIPSLLEFVATKRGVPAEKLAQLSEYVKAGLSPDDLATSVWKVKQPGREGMLRGVGTQLSKELGEGGFEPGKHSGAGQLATSTFAEHALKLPAWAERQVSGPGTIASMMDPLTKRRQQAMAARELEGKSQAPWYIGMPAKTAASMPGFMGVGKVLGTIGGEVGALLPGLSRMLAPGKEAGTLHRLGARAVRHAIPGVGTMAAAEGRPPESWPEFGAWAATGMAMPRRGVWGTFEKDADRAAINEIMDSAWYGSRPGAERVPWGAGRLRQMISPPAAAPPPDMHARVSQMMRGRTPSYPPAGDYIPQVRSLGMPPTVQRVSGVDTPAPQPFTQPGPGATPLVPRYPVDQILDLLKQIK